MKQYLNLLTRVHNEGVDKNTRGVRTRSLFAQTYQHDMKDGFPLLTTKLVNFNAIIHELIWFLSGKDHIRDLQKHTKIWDAWADENGVVPSPYGKFWRDFNGVDQIQNIIDTLKTDPYSRRCVLTAWDPRNAWDSKLPPCHVMAIFNFDGNRLNLHLTQRSGDIPVGVPFNLACYALLLHLMAKEVGMVPGVFSHTIVDAHIYHDQAYGVMTQLARTATNLPKLIIRKSASLNDLLRDDIALSDYNPQPVINFPVQV